MQADTQYYVRYHLNAVPVTERMATILYCAIYGMYGTSSTGITSFNSLFAHSPESLSNSSAFPLA